MPGGYNDFSTISSKLEELNRRLRAVETAPRLTSASIDRGGTQSSDYDGTGMYAPGTKGWMIGTDDTSGIGYVHINGQLVRGFNSIPYTRPTLLNSWTNYSSVYHRAGFYKTAIGTVVLTGLVVGGANATLLMTLPEGYRPDHKMIISLIQNDTHGFIIITPDGNVSADGIATGAWASLDGIMFPAAGTVTWIPIVDYSAGWSSYHTVNGTYPPFSYAKDALGRIWFTGLLRQNTPTTAVTDTNCFSIPERTNTTTHFPGTGNGVFGSFNAVASGTYTAFVVKVGTQTNWISISRYIAVNETVRSDWRVTRNEAFLNGWVNYGSGYPPSRYMPFSDGVIIRDGFVRAGTNAPMVYTEADASGDLAFESASSVTGSMMFLANANNAVARLDHSRLSTVVGPPILNSASGSNVWYSFSGIQYLQGPFFA